MIEIKLFVNILLLVVLLVGITSAQQKQLPEYIKKCSLKHDLKECVIKNANDAIPFIVKGDPNYNVPNMQPLHVPFVSLIDTPQLNLNLTSVEIYGLEKARMIDFIPDQKKEMHFTLVIAVPSTIVSGKYSVSGTVMVLPINAAGNFTLTLTNGVFNYFQELHIISVKGESYYQSRSEELTFNFDNISLQLGNLFNGDKALGDQINKLLNENWAVLFTEFGPVISKTVTKVIQRVFNGIAKIVPAKNVFLSD